jgi:hypothetical protein
LVGEFFRTPGGRPKTKGFENPFQNNPTPCTNQHRTNPNSGYNPKMDLCPQSTRKNEKNMMNLKKVGFRVEKWEKMKT